MNRFTKYLLVTSSLMLSSAASAAPMPDGWYLGLSGDLTWLDHSDTGGGGNIDLGKRFMASSLGDFRIEAEAGYHSASGSEGYGSTHYITYMGNLYYDFTSIFPRSSSGWHVVPYIGGGIGDAQAHFGSSSNNFTATYHSHDNLFAYQGMTGLSLTTASMPNTEWFAGYRYLETDHNDEAHIRSNNMELGLRFNF